MSANSRLFFLLICTLRDLLKPPLPIDALNEIAKNILEKGLYGFS